MRGAQHKGPCQSTNAGTETIPTTTDVPSAAAALLNNCPKSSVSGYLLPVMEYTAEPKVNTRLSEKIEVKKRPIRVTESNLCL